MELTKDTAAAGLERAYKLPYGWTAQEKLASSKSNTARPERMSRKNCSWCGDRIRQYEHPSCHLRFLFHHILSSCPSTFGPELPDVICLSGDCLRIFYVRDLGTASDWASTLIEALLDVVLNARPYSSSQYPPISGTFALVFGLSPPLSASPEPAESSRSLPILFSKFDQPTVKGWGEDNDDDPLRESRTRDRIKKWTEDSLFPDLLSPFNLEFSLFGSRQSSTDTVGKHGHLRWSVVMPGSRNKPRERVARELRRQELNIIRVYLALAATGVSFDSGCTAFSGASERLKRDWATSLIQSQLLSEVVDRTISPSSSVIDEKERKAHVSWGSFSSAWEAHHDFHKNQDSWIRAEINEDRFDEVFQRVKKMGLSRHEKQLLRCVVNPDQIKNGFDAVHLPLHTIDRIRSLVSLPLLHPEVFQSGILKQHSMAGALLFGPPGTGKTHVARAVAKESGARMVAIKPSDIQQKYVGESEKIVTAVFQLARRLMPCIIFIDEIDALFGARTSQGVSSSARHHASLITQFMQEMDGLLASKVVVMGATNRPFDLDDAILRRLPCRVLVDLPDWKTREEILRTMLKDEHLASDVTYEALALRTENYSGSDLKHLCVSAVLAAVKDQVDVPWKSAEKARASVPGNPALIQDNRHPPTSNQEGPTDSTHSLEASKRGRTSSSSALAATIPASDAPSNAGQSPRHVNVQTTSNNRDSPDTSAGSCRQGDNEKPSQRIVYLRHFSHALAEVKPSSTEASISVGLLRKWNKKMGAGEPAQEASTKSSDLHPDTALIDPSDLSDLGSDIWAPNFTRGKKR